jgi:hypothetical protein
VDGSVATSQEELEAGAMEFYSNLFTRQVVLDPGPILACVPERVTAVMNEILAVTFYSRGDTSGSVHDGG